MTDKITKCVSCGTHYVSPGIDRCMCCSWGWGVRLQQTSPDVFDVVVWSRPHGQGASVFSGSWAECRDYVLAQEDGA
jgi:hypothetical protein